MRREVFWIAAAVLLFGAADMGCRGKGDKSDKSSESDAGSDAGGDADSDGDSDTDGPSTWCGEMYGPIKVCEESADRCRFVASVYGTCRQYCRARGGECLSAAPNEEGSCTPLEVVSCDTRGCEMICSCTRQAYDAGKDIDAGTVDGGLCPVDDCFYPGDHHCTVAPESPDLPELCLEYARGTSQQKAKDDCTSRRELLGPPVYGEGPCDLAALQPCGHCPMDWVCGRRFMELWGGIDTCEKDCDPSLDDYLGMNASAAFFCRASRGFVCYGE